jgi:hypothetical protein
MIKMKFTQVFRLQENESINRGGGITKRNSGMGVYVLSRNEKECMNPRAVYFLNLSAF